jgi:hypothetical protein
MTLPRPQEPGSLHEAISDAFTAAGRKRVAAALGVASGTLSRYEDPGENGLRIPAQTLDQFTRMFPGAPAQIIARHFAAIAGGTFCPAQAAPLSPAQACAAVTSGTASLTVQMFAALDPAGPGGADLTPAERAHMSDAVQTLADKLTAMQAALRGAGQ